MNTRENSYVPLPYISWPSPKLLTDLQKINIVSNVYTRRLGIYLEESTALTLTDIPVCSNRNIMKNVQNIILNIEILKTQRNNSKTTYFEMVDINNNNYGLNKININGSQQYCQTTTSGLGSQ